MNAGNLLAVAVFAAVTLPVAAYTWGWYWRGRHEGTKLVIPFRPKPNEANPLGSDAVGNAFQESMRQMVADEVAFTLRGRASKDFDSYPSQHLAMELIARGWVCYKPSEDLKRV